MVVGNTEQFDKPLSSLGTVTNVDITIPPPPGAANEAPAAKPAASNPEGKQLAAKVVEAMGGLAKLQSVKAIHSSLTEKDAEGGSGSTVEVTMVYPDRARIEVKTSHGVLAIVVSPDVGFMYAEGMGQRDLPAAQKNETIEEIQRDPIYIGQHLNDPAFIFFANGTEKIGDVETHILDVRAGEVSIRWFVDPKTGRCLPRSLRDDRPRRSGPAQTDLSDWKTTDGITLPALHKNKQNGQDSSTVEFTSVQFNPPIDPKMFEKPAAKAQQ